MHRRIYVFRFPKEIVDQPIVCELVKRFTLDFNILKATILPLHDGLMVLELRGHEQNVKEALTYVRELGVKAERMATEIRRDEEECYQCGACTGICPTAALHIRRDDMAVLFDPELCSGCGLCVAVCPARAMDVSLNGAVSNLPD